MITTAQELKRAHYINNSLNQLQKTLDNMLDNADINNKTYEILSKKIDNIQASAVLTILNLQKKQ